jgi:Ca2+-binding RTX toxin-like protein
MRWAWGAALVLALGLLPADPSAAGRPFRLWCDHVVVEPTIVGTRGPDEIIGTEGDDIIASLAGADVVYGMGGNDTICTGDGDDRAYGGSGDDVVYGEGGQDLLAGDEGNDRLLGGRHDDVLRGGPGDDFLLGDTGDDIVNGQAGTDMAGLWSPFQSFAGQGRVFANLTKGFSAGCGRGHDTLISIEGLEGSECDDRLVGDGGPNELRDIQGDDVLFGRGGDDVLLGDDDSNPNYTWGRDVLKGGPGDDYLDGGHRFDQLDGGPGWDTCVRGEDVTGCEA